MPFEPAEDRRRVRCWSRFAIQLNGAIDSGKYDGLTVAHVAAALGQGTIFEFLADTLPNEVWTISNLNDVDRHVLSQQWRFLSEAYEPKQFHVGRNGLALLLAYTLHLIDTMHVDAPA
jgi:hypothetical protein